MAFKRPGVRIPLSPPKKYRTNVRYFFMWDRGFPRFHRGVALQHEPLRADADAITEASKAHFLRIPLSPPKNIVHTYDIFLCGIGVSHDFIVVLLCNMNPCGLITNEERRKRVSICGYRVQSHSQQIRHEVSAKGAVQRTIC